MCLKVCLNVTPSQSFSIFGNRMVILKSDILIISSREIFLGKILIDIDR